MAASTNSEYGFSASWYSSYQTVRDNCPFGEWLCNQYGFTTDVSINDEAPGFVIPALNGSPTTEVTLSTPFSLQVAYPLGLVNNISVTGGAYAVSGPTNTSIAGAPYNTYQVWTFTYTGPKTGQTSNADSWIDSWMTTYVDFNDSICVPASGDYYYVRWNGSYTTANGFSYDIPINWIETEMRPA